MTWVVTAIVASSVVTGAYGAQQAKKRQKKSIEQQNVRDLIEGSAPNISNVQEVLVDELQGSDPGALEEALAAMDYQARGEVPIPGEAGVPSAAGDMSQMTEEEALQLLQEQGGIMGMSRGGPIGTPNDTYYFDVGNIMNMMTDANPQIQGVGMQLADQMTANPGMSMVPATPDQIRGMAYGGQVEPKKYDSGGMIDASDIFALLDQTAGAEGRPTSREMEREYLREMMNAPSEERSFLEDAQEQKRIKEAEEASSLFLSEEGPLRKPAIYSEEDARRLADAGPYEPSTLEQLLNRLGTTAQKKGFGIEKRFDQGPLEKLLEARRERNKPPPALGPR
jgi:hypothetical protein